MSMIAEARTIFTLPDPPVLGGGVLAAANVIDTNGHELMGVEAQSDACADVNEWSEWCTMSPVATKIFDAGPDEVVGDPFLIYAGVSCGLQRLDESEARARKRLAYGEGRGVDRNVIAAMDGVAVDLGGPFPTTQAIGVAEAYAAAVYGGRATVLIPRQFVPCACGCGALTSHLDGSLTTCQGSLVANVTAPVALPVTDTGTIYVTGQITLLRGSVFSTSVPQQVTSLAGAFQPARAIAERIYVPLFECFVGKVDVTCT